MVPEVSSTCHQGTVPKPPPYPSPEVRGQGVLLSQQDACLTHNSVLGMAGTVGCGWLSGGGGGRGGAERSRPDEQVGERPGPRELTDRRVACARQQRAAISTGAGRWARGRPGRWKVSGRTDLVRAAEGGAGRRSV